MLITPYATPTGLVIAQSNGVPPVISEQFIAGVPPNPPGEQPVPVAPHQDTDPNAP
jgi:hypothetical protein